MATFVMPPPCLVRFFSVLDHWLQFAIIVVGIAHQFSQQGQLDIVAEAAHMHQSYPRSICALLENHSLHGSRRLPVNLTYAYEVCMRSADKLTLRLDRRLLIFGKFIKCVISILRFRTCSAMREDFFRHMFLECRLVKLRGRGICSKPQISILRESPKMHP